VELKTKGGKLSELQKLHAAALADMKQNYACLWTKEQVNQWLLTITK